MGILKKNFMNYKGRWAEELPRVLWAYLMTVRTPTGEMSFAVTYDSEAVMPIEIGMSSYLVQHYDPNANDNKLREQLDLLEEGRQEAKVQMTSNKRRAKQYFNKVVL